MTRRVVVTEISIEEDCDVLITVDANDMFEVWRFVARFKRLLK